MSLDIPDISDAVEIGRGAFGIVYRARQDSFDRTVAVKVLANVDLDDASLARFAREVRAIGSLSGHPNIVAVHTHGTTPAGAPYMVMEFCASGSYGDALRAGRRLSWMEATEVAIAIAGALETSHRAGILHRDVKPDNILIDGYGQPKLADFGIARQSEHRSVTMTGMLTGSPAHVAPEIIAGEEPSAASDVYSLASAVHALITGESPFVRHTDASILPLLQRVATDPPPSLRQYGVPEPVADVVFATMAKSPQDRPPTALAFAEALQEARRASGAASAPYRVLAAPGGDADADATVLPAAGWQSPGTSPTITASAPTPAATGGAPTAFTGTGQPMSAPAGADATVAAAPQPPASTGSAPPLPPGGPASLAPQPSAGRPRSRVVLPVVIAAAVVLLAGGVGGAVAIATSLQDPGTGPLGPNTQRTPEITTLSDSEAASALVFSAAQLADVSFTDWEQDVAAADVDASAGFCGIPITQVPSQFVQATYNLAIDGPGTLPQVSSAGAVFDTAEQAADYMTERLDTAICESWEIGSATLFVYELPVGDVGIGCDCQEVVAHEIVFSYPDGSSASQFTILSRQDRYIAAAFYGVVGGLPDVDAVHQMTGQLIDLTVLQVDAVAESAVSGG